MSDCFILRPFWKVLGPWGSLGRPGGLSLSFYFSGGGGEMFLSQTSPPAKPGSRQQCVHGCCDRGLLGLCSCCCGDPRCSYITFHHVGLYSLYDGLSLVSNRKCTRCNEIDLTPKGSQMDDFFWGRHCLVTGRVRKSAVMFCGKAKMTNTVTHQTSD